MFLETDAKAPTMTHVWTGPMLGKFIIQLFVKGIRIGSFSGEQLHPQWSFKFVTHKESVVLCLHRLFNIPPIWGREALQLLTPTESTDAYVTELCRDDHFLDNTIKENFFANLR